MPWQICVLKYETTADWFIRIEDKVWNAFYNLQFIGIIWQGLV